ncbi:MAG TPA: hypothetical protein VNW29_00425 [Candidatus Sulfotelmatobacter sp.]|nr:hypothetical protein [Candidatus Sulfotelmatobacter sp.]
MDYLESVLNRYNTTLSLLLPLTPAYSTVVPLLRQWGNSLTFPFSQLIEIKLSGSNAKGTGVLGVTDLDLFISFHQNILTSYNLEQIYNSLAQAMRNAGYNVRRQNVSVRINHNGTEVDLVPGVKFSGNSNDHWLHVTGTGRDRTKTNIDAHISRVTSSGRIKEIRLTKIWRKLNNLDFPSIILEEAVMDALSGYTIGNTANNFWRVLDYLQTDITTAYIIDPANSSNVISNDMTQIVKNTISNAAAASRRQSDWRMIVY